jgi:hypothetical protein
MTSPEIGQRTFANLKSDRLLGSVDNYLSQTIMHAMQIMEK